MLSGIFLIVGTSIGGGMLGLPIVTAPGGILYASGLLLMCWALMTFTAFLTLEVNLCFPKKSNIISMVMATLGKPGVFVCWTVYLLFLYALLAMYIAGGGDVLHGLFKNIGISIDVKILAIAFVLLLGGVVVQGIKHVDRFNFILMFIKIGALFLLMVFVSSHLLLPDFSGSAVKLMPAVTVAITSFGFSIIIPTLRSHFNDDLKTLRKVILFGSLIPLGCYLLWIGMIFSAIPAHGVNGLDALLSSSQPITALLNELNHAVHSEKINCLSKIFTSICVLTAFLCVSLGLFDYISDGLKKLEGEKHLISVTLLTFSPPLLSVLFYPKAFIQFLSLAGFFCIILQAFMPALMAWRVRYSRSKSMHHEYQVFGGKLTLMLAMIVAVLIALIAIYEC